MKSNVPCSSVPRDVEKGNPVHQMPAAGFCQPFSRFDRGPDASEVQDSRSNNAFALLRGRAGPTARCTA